MKIIHRPVTNFVPQQSTQTIYVAEDGKEFLDREKAENHEENLRKRKLIPHNYFEFEGPEEGSFLYLQSMEDLKVLGYEEELEETPELKEKLVFPGWYLIRTVWPDLSDLNKPLLEIYTAKEVKQLLQEAIDSIPE